MNWLDWGILAVVLISTVAALGRGLIVELLSLLGLVLGLVLAGKYYSKLSPHFVILLRVSALADMAAFLLIVVLCLLTMTWLGHGLHKVAHYTGLGWADTALGALFGLLRGLAAVTVTLMALVAFWPLNSLTRESRLTPYFLSAASYAAVMMPSDLHDRIDKGIQALQQLSNVHPWQ